MSVRKGRANVGLASHELTPHTRNNVRKARLESVREEGTSIRLTLSSKQNIRKETEH